MFKKCSCCGVERDADMFYKDPKTGGLRHMCRYCMIRKAKEYVQKMPEAKRLAFFSEQNQRRRERRVAAKNQEGTAPVLSRLSGHAQILADMQDMARARLYV